MDLTLRQEFKGPFAAASIGLVALAIGAVIGGVLVTRGAAEALAVALLPGAVVFLLRSIWSSYLVVVGILALLPFAVLPAGAAVTPALLELALLISFASVGAVVLLDRRYVLRYSGPLALVAVLIGVTVFALVLGLGRGYTTQTLHDYAKFVMAIGAVWLTIQLVHDLSTTRFMLRSLLLAISAAATIGLALYASGPSITERFLVRLVPYGYPGSRIVRFIEDDPTRAMRAIGTNVDPNSFGGLLMVGFVLATGQLIVHRRSIPASLAVGVSGLTGVTMLLTYSRGAWVGAFAGVMLIVLLRRPRLVVPIAALGVVALLFGIGDAFVQRLWLGFTLQDPATKLRLAEYRNAWEIIQQHPLFGVGFGDAPSIELQTGVSSVYLTIAERAGLIGLAIFLVVVGVITWRGLRDSFRIERGEQSDLVLCFVGALVAALTVGLVDHYFFNPQFAHMAALFWIVAGAIIALTSTPEFPAVSGGAAEVSSARQLVGIRQQGGP